jgi:hypothetical protein
MEESSIAAVCQTKKPPTSRRRQEFGLPVKHLRPKPAAGSRQNSFIFVRKAGTPEAIPFQSGALRSAERLPRWVERLPQIV